MKNNYKKFLAILFSATILSGHVMAADAVVVTNVPLPVTDTTDTTSIVSAITGSQTAIIQALQLHASQMTANNQQAVRAQANLQNAVDAREVNRKAEDAKQYGLRQSPSGPSVCNVVTQVVASQNQAAQIAVWREQVQKQSLDFFAGASKTTASSNGAQTAVLQINSGHCAIGATAADVASGQCQAIKAPENASAPAGSTPGNNSGTLGALPTTVSGDQDVMSFLDAPNNVMSPQQLAYSKQFGANVYMSKPLGAMPKGSASSTDGQNIALNRMRATGRFSIVNEVFNNIVLSRADTTGTTLGNVSQVNSAGNNGVSSLSSSGNTPITTNLTQWAEGTAKLTSTYAPVANGKYFPYGVSKAAILELKSKSWYWNPSWALSVDSGNTPANIKDMTLMMSWQIYQNWESYRLQESIALTLATMLSIMEEQNRGKVN